VIINIRFTYFLSAGLVPPSVLFVGLLMFNPLCLCYTVKVHAKFSFGLATSTPV
jgi:hypothetical protein